LCWFELEHIWILAMVLENAVTLHLKATCAAEVRGELISVLIDNEVAGDAIGFW